VKPEPTFESARSPLLLRIRHGQRRYRSRLTPQEFWPWRKFDAAVNDTSFARLAARTRDEHSPTRPPTQRSSRRPQPSACQTYGADHETDLSHAGALQRAFEAPADLVEVRPCTGERMGEHELVIPPGTNSPCSVRSSSPPTTSAIGTAREERADFGDRLRGCLAGNSSSYLGEFLRRRTVLSVAGSWPAHASDLLCHWGPSSGVASRLRCRLSAQ
jgi:hypothetical protein